MAQQTTLGPNALPGRIYGSFEGKVPLLATTVIDLTLKSRSTVLTLEDRTATLTLETRSTALTLEDRE